MKVVIAGLGSTGSFIARYLSKENIDITIIDEDPSRIRDITDTESIAGIVGSCTSLSTLRDADIRNTDLYIAVTTSDETNIFSCYLASLYSGNTKIARIKDTDYLQEDWQNLYRSRKLPIDQLISVDIDLVETLEQKIYYSYLNLADIITFSTDKVKLFSFIVTAESLVINNSVFIVQNHLSEFNDFARIVGIYRNNDFIIPSDDILIKENDKIFVSTATDFLEKAYSIFYPIDDTEIKILEGQQKNIVIAGDNLNAKNIALKLSEKYKRIKLVNKEPFSEEDIIELEGKNIQTILDDITQISYRSNYIYSNEDIIIVTNQHDRKTTLDTLVLKNQGMQNVFCYLHNSYYERFLIDNNVNHILSIDHYIMSSILPNIRRGVILKIFNLHNKVELVELEVLPGAYAVGRRVRELETANIIICALTDENEKNVLRFENNPLIKSGYRIIYIVRRENVKEAENMFAQYIDSDIIM